MTDDRADGVESSQGAESLAVLRDRFLERHLEHWPEEATTLGLHEHDGRLKDLSDAAVEDELDLHRAMRDALGRLDPDRLTTEDQLDVVMMSALSDFHLHVVGDNEDHLINIEMSLHPYLMLQLQQRVAHDADRWQAVSSRVAEVPRFLEQQQALLHRGARAGRTPDSDAVRFIAENQIPHITGFFETFAKQPAKAGVPLDESTRAELRTRCLDAAAAYAEHASFLQREICPSASVRVLGEDEYAFRLKTTLGVTTMPGELIERGRDTLAALRDELMATIRTVDSGVSSFEEALAFVMREKNLRLAERDEDVIPAYRSILDRALEHMKTHELFHFGDEVRSLRLEPPPAALTELVTMTNVAAPLLDEAGSAYFLIQPKAEQHSQIQAVPLTVHEGMPGHSLQSIWWQANRARRPHPVRFLCVPDDVAFARQYFGAMMNVEGWATYAEALMREQGFFSPRESLWAIWCQMAHAARVVVDASLHTHRMTVGEGEQFLVDQLGWSELAQGEVARYRRIPLQALCYLLGRLEILDLREGCRARDGSAFSLADFHHRFFAAGPVAAGHLKSAWLR